MATATNVQVRDKLYIGGKWVDPVGTGTVDVLNPTTEEVIGRVPEGNAEDANRAIEAARAAFDAWSQVSPHERAGYCAAIAAKLDERGDELAALITAEMGMPVGLSRMIQVGLPTMTFGAIPELVEQIEWEEEVGNSLIVREAAGVVAAITPWNYPLHQIANKVAPALAAGCTVALKPSDVVPLNAFVLAEICEAVGLPAGVFNLVTGPGTVVGEALVSHPETDMVSFTGSTRAGKRVSELAAQSVKPVSLELGGKSPNVILDDADLEQAVVDGVAKCFLNSGQTCSALTRMLVPRDKLEQAERIAAAVADEAFTPGDPFADGSALGPLVSDKQRDAVRGYIEKGQAEGAKLVDRRGGAAGGPRRGLLRAADGVLRGHARDDDRPGGDLRAGAGDHAVRRRGRRGPDRQRHDLRARRRRLVSRRGTGQASGRAHPHRPGRDQRRSLQPAGAHSAATSSPGTAASWAATASRSSSWRSRSSSEPVRSDRLYSIHNFSRTPPRRGGA